MLIQSDPFRDLDNLFGRMWTRGGADAAGTMATDAYRRGDDVWVHMDLPGVKVDSLDISLDRNVLTISAERGWQRQEGDQVYLAERHRGNYVRQVHLGDGLDGEHLEADYHDGVLTLRIPVAERAKPRKISINQGGQREAIETTSTSEQR